MTMEEDQDIYNFGSGAPLKSKLFEPNLNRPGFESPPQSSTPQSTAKPGVWNTSPVTPRSGTPTKGTPATPTTGTASSGIPRSRTHLSPPTSSDEETIKSGARSPQVVPRADGQPGVFLDGWADKPGTELLKTIDSLREIGCSEFIDLPQLVCCGEQSAGKSSLLQALTKVPFPVKDSLGTRFVTEVRLLRSLPGQLPEFTVSITPGPNATKKHAKKLAQFKSSPQELTAKSLEDLIETAASWMGLPPLQDSDVIKRSDKYSDTEQHLLSEDMLTIEVSAPDQPHFTIVDVPGIRANGSDFDLELARNLVKKYMRNPRSIIVIVFQAVTEPVTQGVLKLAQEHDKEGKRTIGVLTKCDRVENLNQNKYLELIRNEHQGHKLQLGWYGVRLKAHEDLKKDEALVRRGLSPVPGKDIENDFFNTAPWNTLDKERVGVDSLRKSLISLQYNLIKEQFPKVMEELRSKLSDCEADLKTLGATRETSDVQREFLTGLATKVQIKVNKSLQGQYDWTWKSDDARKLRYHVQNSLDHFADEMRENGSTYKFHTIEEDAEAIMPLRKDPRWILEPTRWVEAVTAPGDNIYAQIENSFKNFRGPELRDDPPSGLKSSLFNMQTKNWERIATEQLNSSENLVSHCSSMIFAEVCTEPKIRDRLLATLGLECETAFSRAQDRLKKIVEDERGDIILSQNPILRSQPRKDNHARIEAFLHDHKREESAYHYMEATLSRTHCFAIHDSLKAYYENAMYRFIDNVALQVIERYHLGAEGPLRVFSPSWVSSLDKQTLEEICGEDAETKERRRGLSDKHEKLTRGLKQARGY